MATFNSSTGSMEQITEVYVKRILAGNVGEVRRRIIVSLETLGYDVIEEEPHIIGRRGAKGWGVWLGSADVFDYPMTLTVRLKPISRNSTQATFDYLIKHPMLNRGEKALVAHEAKTIASISKKPSIEKWCPGCETESTDDSKFCRRCGTPLTSEQSELEILRMMAEVRAGKTSVVTSTVLTTASTILLFAVIILKSVGLLENPKAFFTLLIFGGITALLSILMTVFVWNRTNRALEKPSDPHKNLSQYIPETFPEKLETGEFAQLPPPINHASVTEGTTNLLDTEWRKNRELEKIPVANRRETKELN
ncbi:MAG: zinc ribbon domain-containing protein [Pyrinomonadaceae bacterium]|nr:zinc ribbon domain-containing protein [Pyrinomonadaceae bacterium]